MYPYIRTQCVRQYRRCNRQQQSVEGDIFIARIVITELYVYLAIVEYNLLCLIVKKKKTFINIKLN